jgi:protein-tyrosine sulfotransferase
MVTDRPIIIGGSHRSGTTLLRRLLNGHPRIFCPAEIKFYKDLLGQFTTDPLAHGRLGSSISALGLPTEVWLDEFGHALCRCYDLATRNAGKARWADKSPENAINIIHWNRLLGGRMVFVLVVRHPFDVIASMAETRMDNVFLPDIDARAQHVADYLAAGHSFAKEHAEHSMIVRYEDLVKQPRGTLESLMNWIGETYDEKMISSLGSEIHGLGLQDPKSRRRGEISGENIGRWRRDLSPDDIKRARPIVASIAKLIGYEVG